MRIGVDGLAVRPGEPARLGERATRAVPPFGDKGEYRRLLAGHVAAMAEWQALLAADRSRALLVVIQAMDAGGKDGTVRHVFSGLNPQGCAVTSFKPPSAEEAGHDFLWRTTARLPGRGGIGVFNRSYYEEVVTVRVHPGLLGAQHVAAGPGLWAERFGAINAFERHLAAEGTRIVKLFLHISAEEQRQRLLARLDDPAKTWKFDEGDLVERARWDDYQAAYEACLSATGTEAAPWCVVPADDKRTARLLVGRIVLDAMEGMPLRAPEVAAEMRDRLAEARARLTAEAPALPA